MQIRDHVSHADNIIKISMSHELIHGALRELSHYDTYTFWHSVSVARMSLILGMSIGLPEDKLYQLAYSALLHDIGKIEVPKSVLRKRNALTKIEMVSLLKHPKAGARRIADRGVMPQAVLDAIENHHENMDGSGYYKKKGEEIGQFAQIIRICDTYDAMADDRPYRSGLAKREIYNTLMAGSGREFNSEYVSIFFKIKDHGKIPNYATQREQYENHRFTTSVKLA